jgi:hypothetical protein
MRKIALVTPALLFACSTAPATPIHGVTPGHKCDATGTATFIGQPGTSETGTAIKRATKAAVLRWAPPGVMLTMDFREDRVTVYLGADKKVTKINCG